MHALFLASALLAGCLLAVQASVNLQLNKAVGTPYGASTLQLGVATALLALLAAAVGAIGAIRLAPGVPFWHLLGGLASPLYITSGILLFPRLGALAAAGLFVTGQMFASLGLDLFGLLGIARRPLSVGIVLGALAVLAGITVIIRGQRPAQTPPAAGPATGGGSGGSGGPGRGATATATAPAATAVRRTRGLGQSGWILLGIVAGAVLPVQGAVNAALRKDIREPVTTAMISFIVATITIAVVLLVLLATRRTPRPQLGGLRTMPWWGWLGGACAAAYVTATFTLIPTIGAATTVALTVTGQQVASAVIDNYGFLRLPRRPLTAPRLSGLALLIVGSVLVQLT
ncbi:DMT family transporter [Microbispora hainanensis]|uniref:DMT family transporter n=2 Tax=Microbispora hainanensis TaxID=568844 RepID=A0ABZ1SR52_9ACTN|nr:MULTISPECIES: DMT family transporter [Microbispora]NJP27390.1 DMT family transporter [Microbispora sp. CL1-1]TQS11179.1 DMT family transporter [Microbispora sp. SCL1-1]